MEVWKKGENLMAWTEVPNELVTFEFEVGTDMNLKGHYKGFQIEMAISDADGMTHDQLKEKMKTFYQNDDN